METQTYSYYNKYFEFVSRHSPFQISTSDTQNSICCHLSFHKENMEEIWVRTIVSQYAEHAVDYDLVKEKVGQYA